MIPAMSEPQPESQEAAARPLPMLRGERVWLRAAVKADITVGPNWVADAEIGHFLGMKMPVGEDGAAEFAQIDIDVAMRLLTAGWAAVERGLPFEE